MSLLRRSRVFALLAGLAPAVGTLAPARASAQVAIDAQFGAGVAVPRTDLKDFAGNGLALQAAVTGSIPYTPLAVRGELLYMSLPAVAAGDATTTITVFGADLLYKFALGATHPYVLLGPAFYRGNYARQFNDDRTHMLLRGGFNAGAGIRAGRGRTQAFAEATYHALRVEGNGSENTQPRLLLFTGGVQIDVRPGRIRRPL